MSAFKTVNPLILVLGGEGMLGHKVFQILSNRFPTAKCTIQGSLNDHLYKNIPLFNAANSVEKVNAMEFQVLKKRLKELRPDFLINCIGIIKQRPEAQSPIPSITLNALLPHLLAEWASEWGGRLIHFSTDCVFSGKKGNYSENDPSDADDLYGKSKYLGEVASSNSLTLRTSIIGRELNHFTSLLEWFLAQNGKSVKGYRKVIWSGVTTNFLAGLVGKIISEHPTLFGLFQVSAPAISKHDLLIRLRTAYDLDIEIIPDDSEISDRSLNGERFRKATGYKEPTWDELIVQLANDKTPYKKWREKQ